MFRPSVHLINKEIREKKFKSILSTVTFFLFLPALIIIFWLFMKGYPALSWDFITMDPIDGMTAGGIFPTIVGTFWLVMISVLVSCPLGVVAAIYLSEYAPDNKVTRMIRLAILNLAGVPSIVHALFGLGAFVLFLKMGTSILAASFTLAVMNLPVIITSTLESLKAVPQSYREASWNVGASKLQTIRHIVLPNSIPGILTGLVFAVGRSAGETAAILFTGVAFYLPFLPQTVFDQCMALSMHLFTISTQVVGVPDAYPFATALVLILLILSVNSIAVVLRYYFRTRRKW
ncbi:phosphate ABC transporter permease PstA [Peredibacter starrii]|uniref:Phosphate transport system permease protein PstA n=1 Tax=Peredibacter starrii TaxID=28202 RepID=A0AAX4HSR3_9BACT|nr:phosphate ABC transporter permease PstA [Peredibacter starrii]WPU66302.1 phosphate ABC transporter permease PstA [Peredibacter starrii]